jgi:hypothetical protein
MSHIFAYSIDHVEKIIRVKPNDIIKIIEFRHILFVEYKYRKINSISKNRQNKPKIIQ